MELDRGEEGVALPAIPPLLRRFPQLYVIVHIDPAALSSIPPYLTILFERTQLCGKASRPASVLSELAPNVYLLHQIFPRVVAISLVHI
jgi:hypothetical protein